MARAEVGFGLPEEGERERERERETERERQRERERDPTSSWRRFTLIGFFIARLLAGEEGDGRRETGDYQWQ